MSHPYPIATRTLSGLGGGKGLSVTQVIEVLEELGRSDSSYNTKEFWWNNFTLNQTHSLYGTDDARTLHLSFEACSFILKPEHTVRLTIGQPYHVLVLESVTQGGVTYEDSGEAIVKRFKVLYGVLQQALNASTRGAV
jgi:hypothetical protein